MPGENGKKKSGKKKARASRAQTTSVKKKATKPVKGPVQNKVSSFSQQSIELSKILLDPQNPRLPPEYKGKPESELLKVMIERFAISEIADSINSAGFLPVDQIVVCKDSDHYIVIEGNRRIATLKLLAEPDLAPDPYKSKWHEYKAGLDKKVLESIKKIPVVVYPTRDADSVLSYVGFRHVNGILSWESEEKAAFVAMLVEEHGWDYRAIAKHLGSNRAHIEKLYVSHRLVEQARDNGVPGADRMRSSFGTLTRALQSPGVKSFLQVDLPDNPEISSQPSKAHARDLEDFVRWTFGTDEVKPVLEDSRDLTKWGQILSEDESVRYMRGTPSPRFDRAYAKSGGLKDGLVDSVFAAADRLEEAVPLVRKYKADESLIKAIDNCSDYLSQVLIHFPDIRSRYFTGEE